MGGNRNQNRKAEIANSKLDLFNQLAIFTIAATIISIPFIFDAFTVSKIFVLTGGLFFLSIQLVTLKDLNQLNYLPKRYVLVLTLLVLAIISSSLQSGVPFERAMFGQFGRGNGVLYYLLVILIFAFAAKTYKNSQVRTLHRLLTWLSWFMSIYATLQHLGFDIAKLDTKGISSVVLTFGNSNFAGGMLAVLFSYQITYMVVSRKYEAKSLVLLGALVVSSTFAAAVQGYLIILFSIFSAFSILVTQKINSRIVSRGLLAFWLFGGISVVLGIFGKFVFAGVFARSTFQARIDYWKITLEIIKDYPFFGIGPDKLYDVTGSYMSPGTLKVITTTRMDNAHNWYLNFGANFGLISLLLLLILFMFVFLKSFSLIKNSKSALPVSVACAMAFISMFIDGLVSLEQPGLGFWLYLFAGIVIGSSLQENRDQEINSKPLKNAIRGASKATRYSLVAISSLLALSVVLVGNRVVLDGILRSKVQSALLNKADVNTFASMSSLTKKLRAEPEYAVQALKPLASVGDARSLDMITYELYEYNRDSIQATLIRSDVLRALNRQGESCPLRSQLIRNTPWDFYQLEVYIECLYNGYTDEDKLKNLKLANVYLKPIDELKNEVDGVDKEFLLEKLKKAAISTFVKRTLGLRDEYATHEKYSLSLVSRVQTELVLTPERLNLFNYYSNLLKL
jgi:O-antigen ligase